MKYRFYVDEVGNSDLGASHDPNHRYLSLTGVIMELGYVDATVFPALEALKRKYFGSHPDEPIILYRKELVNKKQSFSVLNDPAVEGAFNAELIALLQNLEYVVITAVIDKLEHKQRYQVWQNDPYHYCLTVLVERYALWLRAKGAVGDVMAESRGKKEDQRLKGREGKNLPPPVVWINLIIERTRLAVKYSAPFPRIRHSVLCAPP